MGSGCSLAHLIGPSLFFNNYAKRKTNERLVGAQHFLMQSFTDVDTCRNFTSGIQIATVKHKRRPRRKESAVSWCAGMRAISKMNDDDHYFSFKNDMRIKYI